MGLPVNVFEQLEDPPDRGPIGRPPLLVREISLKGHQRLPKEFFSQGIDQEGHGHDCHERHNAFLLLEEEVLHVKAGIFEEAIAPFDSGPLSLVGRDQVSGGDGLKRDGVRGQHKDPLGGKSGRNGLRNGSGRGRDRHSEELRLGALLGASF